MTAARDRGIAAAIAVLAIAITLAASTRQGITRDEAYYMKAGEIYAGYYEGALRGRIDQPFSDATIGRFWGYNPEHPPLLKTLYGVSWRVLRGSGLSEVTAFRLPTAVCFGMLCALVYVWYVAAVGSRWGGAAAALLMFAQPRAFFHAQTASFDLPIAAFWVAAAYAYWRSLESASWRGAVAPGLMFGLCLATKLQSFLLPVALSLHCAWLMRKGMSVRVRAALRALTTMALLGPATLFALWPWLWHDTIARLRAYLLFHLEHVHYNFEYLGRNYNQPPYPWHEPIGMLVFTAPVVTLVLAATGIALLAGRPAAFARDERSTRALWLLAGFVPVAIFLAGRQPIYGETKHWLATMPFLALAAGFAFDRLRAALAGELGADRDQPRFILSAALLVVVTLPAAAEVRHSHPYGLSHYNALAGGPPGGADLGLNRQFWGYSVKALLPWLNATLAPRAVLYPHDWNHDAWERYVRAGELRADIVETGEVRGSDAALVIHEKHFNEFDYRIWEEYGHVQPDEVLTLDGVPLVSVYRRVK